MGAQTSKAMGQGTINGFREVKVDAVSSVFAMVIPDDGCRCRLAVRIWPQVAAPGGEGFVVGDKVRYTVLAGEFPRAQDLVKLEAESECI